MKGKRRIYVTDKAIRKPKHPKAAVTNANRRLAAGGDSFPDVKWVCLRSFLSWVQWSFSYVSFILYIDDLPIRCVTVFRIGRLHSKAQRNYYITVYICRYEQLVPLHEMWKAYMKNAYVGKLYVFRFFCCLTSFGSMQMVSKEPLESWIFCLEGGGGVRGSVIAGWLGLFFFFWCD